MGKPPTKTTALALLGGPHHCRVRNQRPCWVGFLSLSGCLPMGEKGTA
jgi:hypothetical protein